MIVHAPPIHAARAGGEVEGAGVAFQHITAYLPLFPTQITGFPLALRGVDRHGGVIKSKKRWIAPRAELETRPAICHCVSRVVDRRFVFGDEEREVFRMFMRMMENFSGCRVLSYCVSNHFHVLLNGQTAL